MNRALSWITGLLAPLAVLLVAGPAHAWVPVDGATPTWANMPVTYKVNTGSIPGSISGIGVARVDAGFATWGSPSCTFFEAQNGGSTSAGSNYNDGQNVIRWQSGSWNPQLGDVNSVIGVTSPVWDNNGNIGDADIIFNNVGFCWDDAGNGCVDTQSIATHEEGHFLGLGHTNVNGATMEPFYGGGTSLRTIEQDDQDGVCALYPSGGQAASSGSGGGDCQSCANTSQNGTCSGDTNACGSNQDCVDLFNCLQGCNDQACVDGCANTYPNGVAPYNALIECICNACATECAMECGGSSSSASSGATSGNGAGVTNGAGGGAPTGAGVGGAVVGAGASTASWNSDDEDPGALKKGDTSGDSGGCGCSAGDRSTAGLGLFALALALGATAVRRTRRRG